MSAPAGLAVEFAAPEAVELVNVDRPTPAPDEVVVETIVSAVSAGTERLVYQGAVDRTALADERLPGLEGTLSYPIRYGYAAVGSVVATGRDVDPSWGDVTVFAFNPHESYFRARPADLVRVPPNVAPERAAFLAKLETAITFMLDGAPLFGENVGVFGQGVIGLLTTALMARSPVDTVLAIDPIARRRELALHLGADRTIDPTESDPARIIQAEVGGVDLAIEVSGDPATLEPAVKSTRYGGRVLVGSWYGTKRAPIGLGVHFHRGRISVESSQVSTIDPALSGRWTRTRRRDLAATTLAEIDVERLVTHRIPIAEAPEAYRLLEHPNEAVQILLTYE